MAEAAGLALGVTALFNTCVESFKIVFAAQDFARDFEILNTSFQQQRLRLLLWGQSVGIISRQGVKLKPYLQELDADHVRPIISRSLEAIRCLLEQFKGLESRYGLKDHATAGLFRVSSPKAAAFGDIVRRNQKQKSARSVAKWAVFDAEQMRDAIAQLKALIDGLVNITNELRNMTELETGSLATESAVSDSTDRNYKAQELSTGTRASRQILALDLHSSVETFDTAQELLGSIETFNTALCSTNQPTIYFTAEDIHSRPSAKPGQGGPEVSNASDWAKAEWFPDLMDVCAPSPSAFLIDPYETQAKFKLPLQPAPKTQAIMPSAENVYPSVPRDFAENFPTDQKIFITHDDAQLDGDMNLRMCVSSKRGNSKSIYVSLFHLRMHNLRERDFSFRRYCRDSGREICRSALQLAQAQAKKSRSSVFSRSLTRVNSIGRASFGSKTQLPTSSARSSRSSMISWFSRRSSASSHASNGSSVSEHGLDGEATTEAEEVVDVAAEQTSRKTIKLEFSNYLRVDLQRRGRQGRKKYTFTYWGDNYQWKRRVDSTRKIASDCYGHSLHLYREGSNEPVAHIEPALDAHVAKEGWVPPSAMRIMSQEIIQSNSDISDVIVATGIIALADNAIRSYLTALVDGETSLRDIVMKDPAE